MKDEDVERLLLSQERLVLVEAPAGCGKTYQGAKYADIESSALAAGRLLILTHTHSACGVFSERTKGNKKRVDIITIDSLIVQIAATYYKILSIPCDVSAWARSTKDGFDVLAHKVEQLLSNKSIISQALVSRYPVIVCDEHQDTSKAQHKIILELFKAGAKLRVFGDPMQALYANTKKKFEETIANWKELKALGSYAKLEVPHRWSKGEFLLGEWVLEARRALRDDGVIDLTGSLPPGLNISVVDNSSRTTGVYLLDSDQRKGIDKIVRENDRLLVLASTNRTVNSLRSAFFRQLVIWEGHTRGNLSQLVDTLSTPNLNPVDVAEATVSFIGSICVGFRASSHGKIFIKEVREGGTGKATRMPLHIQNMARHIIGYPNHIGVSKVLVHLKELVDAREAGFQDIKIDYFAEFNDAIRIGSYGDASEGFREISRIRSYMKPEPPDKCLSTIHKAKGLECNNAIIMACDRDHFSSSDYAIRKLYVALSRAKSQLTIVLSARNPTPLIKYNY
ncbi:MAG: UvrD-helicase domain-containing protein [Pseudomonadales bacterium]|nr:UvrD-helicase domain-containing protein [Pseudomonadales bacterium]